MLLGVAVGLCLFFQAKALLAQIQSIHVASSLNWSRFFWFKLFMDWSIYGSFNSINSWIIGLGHKFFGEKYCFALILWFQILLNLLCSSPPPFFLFLPAGPLQLGPSQLFPSAKNPQSNPKNSDSLEFDPSHFYWRMPGIVSSGPSPWSTSVHSGPGKALAQALK